MYFSDKGRNFPFEAMESLFERVKGLFSLIVVEVIIGAPVMTVHIVLPLLDLWVASGLTRMVVVVIFSDKTLNILFCILNAYGQLIGLFRFCFSNFVEMCPEKSSLKVYWSSDQYKYREGEITREPMIAHKERHTTRSSSDGEKGASLATSRVKERYPIGMS